MSDMQEILANLIVALNEGQINAEVIEGAMKALSAVPEIYHVDAVKALLRTPSAPEEQPEDYLAVKTFSKRAQSSLQIGDELIDMHGVKSVFVGTDENGEISVVYGTGGVDHWNLDRLNRTGRNFPAIAAIMEELKKA